MSRPKRFLIAGPHGGIGSALRRYLAANHPEIDIVPLVPFPFDYGALHSALVAGADYFVNCAAEGSDSESHERPLDFIETNVWGTARQLEMIRRYAPQCRYLSIGTVYEATGHSTYSATKRCSRELVRAYRENHGLYALQCSLGFTESVGRADGYLSRKIVKAAVRIKRALDRGEAFESLHVKNVDQRFVWTWADDVAEGMWRMLNQETHSNSTAWARINRDCGKPIDPAILEPLREYALMSGEAHSVREFVELAFAAIGIPLTWLPYKDSLNEYAVWWDSPHGVATMVEAENGDHVLPDPIIDTQAHTDLNWHPRFTLKDIVHEMVVAELARESPRSKTQ